MKLPLGSVTVSQFGSLPQVSGFVLGGKLSGLFGFASVFLDLLNPLVINRQSDNFNTFSNDCDIWGITENGRMIDEHSLFLYC